MTKKFFITEINFTIYLKITFFYIYKSWHETIYTIKNTKFMEQLFNEEKIIIIK